MKLGSLLSIFRNSTVTPSLPSDGLVLTERRRGGRRSLFMLNQYEAMALQRAFHERPVGWMTTVPNATSWNSMGISGTITNTGTTAANAVTSSNAITRMRHIRYTAAAGTAGTVCGIKSTVLHPFFKTQGYYFQWFFGTDTVLTDGIYFCGLRNDTAAIAGNTEASAFVNCVGVGKDTTDTNIQLLFNDGTGTCVKIDTGFAFVNNHIYSLEIFCPVGGALVYASIEDLVNGNYAEGSEAVDVPSGSTALTFTLHASNSANTASTVVSASSLYAEFGF